MSTTEVEVEAAEVIMPQVMAHKAKVEMVVEQMVKIEL